MLASDSWIRMVIAESALVTVQQQDVQGRSVKSVGKEWKEGAVATHTLYTSYYYSVPRPPPSCATQAKLISRGTQKCDPKCATIPVTRFA